MTGFGVAMAALIFVSTYFYEEKHYQQEEKQPPFFQSLVECFRNRSFIVFEVISFTIIYVQTSLMLGLNYYLAEFSIPAVPLYAALGVGIIGGVFFFVKMRDPHGGQSFTIAHGSRFLCGCFMVLVGGRLFLPRWWVLLLWNWFCRWHVPDPVDEWRCGRYG